MDYEEILAREAERMVGESNGFGGLGGNPCEVMGSEVFGDRDYLTTHVPEEGDVVKAFREMAYENGDRSVKLVPLRPYLQSKLAVTPERLDDMVASNPWIGAWMGYVRALQGVKILEIFGSGNMDDGRMKWLLWAVLGEPIDIVSGRPETAMGTESILKELNNASY